MNRNLSPQQFQVEVEWAHDKDTLKTGETHAGTSYVSVGAKDADEATLTAQQMVAARGREPTRARLVE